jgi:hypothetical protein
VDILDRYNKNSDALLGLLRGERSVYMKNPAMRAMIERFERDMRGNPSEAQWNRRVRELVRDLANFSRRDGDTLDGHFYDYFQTSLYFDTSIPLQKDFRQRLTEHLEERERDFRALMTGR